ncbi:hypothetical protein TrVE_jg971 [Triparma verrucosa]|uniref:Uncharacterized protein n=1 Tax=Triparma verrucosa TaxID=1606542 RepID=A0A9W7KV59_9STRA|nr:hypothetical protein TrVE_jg971 [Triparma verrucosa]
MPASCSSPLSQPAADYVDIMNMVSGLFGSRNHNRKDEDTGSGSGRTTSEGGSESDVGGEGNGTIDFQGVSLELPSKSWSFDSAIFVGNTTVSGSGSGSGSGSSKDEYKRHRSLPKRFLESIDDCKGYFEARSDKVCVVVEASHNAEDPGAFKVVKASDKFLELSKYGTAEEIIGLPLDSIISDHRLTLASLKKYGSAKNQKRKRVDNFEGMDCILSCRTTCRVKVNPDRYDEEETNVHEKEMKLKVMGLANLPTLSSATPTSASRSGSPPGPPPPPPPTPSSLPHPTTSYYSQALLSLPTDDVPGVASLQSQQSVQPPKSPARDFHLPVTVFDSGYEADNNHELSSSPNTSPNTEFDQPHVELPRAIMPYNIGPHITQTRLHEEESYKRHQFLPKGKSVSHVLLILGSEE